MRHNRAFSAALLRSATRSRLIIVAAWSLPIIVSACDEVPVMPDTREEESSFETVVLPSGLAISGLQVASGRGYLVETEGLGDGKHAYVDRSYTYENVPLLVQGTAYIRTADADQTSTTQDGFLSFRTNREAVVYVAYNGGDPPAWLRDGFSATGQSLRVARGKDELAFDLYTRTFPAGEVTLGGNGAADSAAAMYTVMVEATNMPPIADAGGPYSGAPGAPVQFDGGGSADRDGSLPLTFAWSFGDGNTGIGERPTHTYADTGTYRITLTVTDARGASSEAAFATSTVTAPPTAASSDSASADFAAVVRGIRPRGFGQGTYTLAQPAAGGKTLFVSTGGSDGNPGTSSAPFRTINRAAQAAVAGDVVTIRAGTYRETVSVKNAGTAGKPIVFQAEQRGQVVLTGGQYHFVPASWNGGVRQTGATHVTLRGLVFRAYAPEVSDPRTKAAVGSIRGWTIEDCLFDKAGYSGLDIRGDSVTVVRSTFQYHHTYALTGSGDVSVPHLRGIRISDIVLRGNNTRSDPLSGAAAAKVVKFWYTRDVVVDNIESYENNGPGWWFDSENFNYSIRDSYFHHNATSSGRGVLLEKNRAPGLVENNVFAYNVGSGMGIFNSEGVSVIGNLFVGDGRSIYLINRDWGGEWVLRNLKFEGNSFKGWTSPSAIHTMAEGMGTAAEMNITADRNIYDPSSDDVLTSWKDTGQLRTLTELRNKLGWEQNGRIESIVSPL